MGARDRNLGILSSSLWLTTLLLLSSLKLRSHIMLFYYSSVYSLKLFRIKLFGSIQKISALKIDALFLLPIQKSILT
jgi:hypothetical protein